VQEGDVNRRFRRSVSFVTGASAVIVALALMAVADGGGKLPGIGQLPVLGIPGLGPRTAAPAKPRKPVETPNDSSRPIASQSATPTPVLFPEGAGTNPSSTAPATDLVPIDNPPPVTPPLVTPQPVAKKPRPEPVPVTSPSAPPNETPPKRPFGGPGIAGAHGSGRGLGSGSAGTTSGGKGNGKQNGKHGGKQNGKQNAQQNATHGPKKNKAKGKAKTKPAPSAQPPHATDARSDDGAGPQHDGSCPATLASAAR
jgi:hypothetical protein